MTDLIFQVAVGPESNLYEQCIQSVKEYAERIEATHVILREPVVKKLPDMSRTGRSDEAVKKYKCKAAPVGYLPIFEKEHVFTLFQMNPGVQRVAVIDADVYIRKSTNHSIFDQLGNAHFSAMIEATMPCRNEYRVKLKGYSRMQYGKFKNKITWIDNVAQFRNMGVMLMTRDIMSYPSLKAPKDEFAAEFFLDRPQFKDFVDGIGHYKWSTDQTLLNYWLEDEMVLTSDMDWRWNAMYTAVEYERVKEAWAVHFFLKDKLPNKGENFVELLKKVGE